MIFPSRKTWPPRIFGQFLCENWQVTDPETWRIPKLLGRLWTSWKFWISFFPGNFLAVILTCKIMTADAGMIPVSQLQFNDHYKGQLNQLPPFIKKKYG